MTGSGESTFDAKAFLATVGPGQAVCDLRRGDVVFRQSTVADAVFYIRKGQIKIAVASPQGKEAVVGIMSPGDFIGEGCLGGQSVRLASATAMTDSQVVRVSKDKMIHVLHDHPSFAALFRTHLMTRNNRIEDDLVDQLFNSSEKRLARTLLLLANIGEDGAPRAIATPISQETLAEIIGTSRSRVSGFMNKFRKLGFIEYNGHVKVNSSLLNVLLSD